MELVTSSGRRLEDQEVMGYYGFTQDIDLTLHIYPRADDEDSTTANDDDGSSCTIM